jgi:hypothetical protein
MRTCLFLILASAAGAAPIPDEVRKDNGPIKAADFPNVARRIDAFEERINSPRVEDRTAVLGQLTHDWYLPNAEMVRFLKRVAKHDADAWVRGTAIKELHDAWIPLDPGELPTSFIGYHRGLTIDRQRKDLAADLIAQVRQGDLSGGYAAYAVGLLRLKEAVPDLRNLAESKNVFVRYSAGRALVECGDKVAGAAILKTIMNGGVPVNAPIGQLEDPYYQALAARAFMEVGPIEKKAATERLIELMKELEAWTDINAQGRLQTARRELGRVSGQYFTSHQDARAWLEKRKP